MAFCRYLFVVAFVTALSVALVMTIKRTALARKMASFSVQAKFTQFYAKRTKDETT